MRIKNLNCQNLSVPLERTFVTAVRRTDTIEDLCVRIELEDGTVGRGTAPVTPPVTGETRDGMVQVIHQYLAPLLMNASLWDYRHLLGSINQALPGNYGAKMAVDTAVFDALSQLYDQPLQQVLGTTANTLNTDISISCGTAEQTRQAVDEAAAKGFRRLKVKMGKNIQEDLALLKVLKRVMPAQAGLSIDANQGWTFKQACQFVRALEHLDMPLEVLEQPVAADDIASLGQITRLCPFPVAADESVGTPQQAARLLAAGAADMINIKLVKCGGIAEALKLCHVARSFQAQCMVGCMMESPAGIKAAAAFALAAGIDIVDLDPLDWVAASALHGILTFDAPQIILPGGGSC